MSARQRADRLPPAVLLAAGESSRFWPLSTHGHKSLHRLAGKAIIEHTVESLAAAGVTDIIILQSPIARPVGPRAAAAPPLFKHRAVADQLGDGTRYGVRISYLDQVEAAGPGPAIRQVVSGLRGDFFLVYPENLNAGKIIRELWEARQGADAVVAGQVQEATWLFGVFDLDGDRLRGMVEKPPAGKEPSQVCNMGVGLFGPSYRQAVLDQSEHEFSNIFALKTLAQSQLVRVVTTTQPFFPLKYPWHLFAMARHLTGPDGWRGQKLSIADSAKIGSGCLIENDCRIGPGVSLQNCLIGRGSVVLSSLSDSILGAAVTVEAKATVEHRPLSHGEVTVDVKGHAIATGLPELGAAIGQGTTIKSGSRLAPGVLVGAEATVAGEVGRNLPDRARLS